MTDLTAAVEAAARAMCSGDWDAAPPVVKFTLREGLLPAVVAAATVVRAQALMEARDAVGGLRTRFQGRASVGDALAAIDALGAEVAG